jgi:hypothetical protein
MRSRYYRICPYPNFQWNNRWHPKVFPKHSVFVIPILQNKEDNQEHLKAWLNFLKRSHRKRILWVYTLDVEHSNTKQRVLTTWKGTKLYEVIIPVDNLGSKHVVYTRRM